MEIQIILALSAVVATFLLMLGLANENDKLQAFSGALMFCSVFALFITLH